MATADDDSGETPPSRDAGPPSPLPRPRTRRTRFVCISDTHNCTVKLPKGDVLIHAGDLTNMGSYTEVGRSLVGSVLAAHLPTFLSVDARGRSTNKTEKTQTNQKTDR